MCACISVNVLWHWQLQLALQCGTCNVSYLRVMDLWKCELINLEGLGLVEPF